jgi:hypothetical protein
MKITATEFKAKSLALIDQLDVPDPLTNPTLPLPSTVSVQVAGAPRRAGTRSPLLCRKGRIQWNIW